MSVRNVKTSQERIHQRRTQKLEAAAPTGFSSVTRGQFRIASIEGLLVEGSASVSGRLDVTGIEVVSGQLRVTGSLVVAGNAEVTGPMTVSGPLTVNGETTFVGPLSIEGQTTVVGTLVVEGDVTFTGKTILNGETKLNGDTEITGDTTITGETEITGDTKIRGDMEVLGEGKIRVGRITLNPKGGDLGNGSIDVSSGLNVNAPSVTFADRVVVKGGLSTESAAFFKGLGRTTTKTPNVYIDPVSGQMLLVG